MVNFATVSFPNILDPAISTTSLGLVAVQIIASCFDANTKTTMPPD